MQESGYQRDALEQEQEDAVRWWYFEARGPFAFARGGRVRTARQARKKIREAAEMAQFEYDRRQARPTHRMEPDGSLTLIEWPEPTAFGGPVAGFYASRF